MPENYDLANGVPRPGEVRWGNAKDAYGHDYKGVRPYLVISNEKFNKYSGECEAIPFTKKRWHKHSPVHVNFATGEIDGLYYDSTLMVENKTKLKTVELGPAIDVLEFNQLKKVSQAMVIQNPILDYADHGGNKKLHN